MFFVSKYLNECELLYLEDHGRDLSNMRVWSHLGENELPQTHLRSHFGKERNNQNTIIVGEGMRGRKGEEGREGKEGKKGRRKKPYG